MPGAPGIPPFLPQKQKIFAVHLENIDAGITPNELRDFLGELGHIADVNFNKGFAKVIYIVKRKRTGCTPFQ
uniref:RRM domain-containing protein n=1 Tax=Ditylenchus dipsaci TaxID=166011 RepID=A0A915ERA6_9BILA